MNSNIYVLGTGLSHDGSAVLLKNGKVCVAIEKERLTRIKHDGGNDTLAIQYCLDAEGIQLEDLSLVVQCANFEIPEKKYHKGKRLFSKKGSLEVVDISHHLAHAYSAVGTSPFNECNVMVIDGCGSPLTQYLALHPEEKHLIPDSIFAMNAMQCEKDSFYHFDGKKLTSLWKDFSPMSDNHSDGIQLPTTQHSIGGFYAAISHYVFGNMDDVGKLMGLAPFGESGIYEMDAFMYKEGSLHVTDQWKTFLTKPSSGYDHFKKHFKYYADIAKWAQEQVEKAVIQCIKSRMERFPHKNLCYSGGVALNAAANRKVIEKKIAEQIYFEPAAADNGLALGCAFYGWLEYLGKDKVPHNGDTCFGKEYDQKECIAAIEKDSNTQYTQELFTDENDMLQQVAFELNAGKTVAWFQSGSEFGPRSLGRRSILAHPGKENLQNHINKNIKFREDFRPFAPAILKSHVQEYFVAGRESPYMILLDHTRQEYVTQLKNVTHCDGTARVQTVDSLWNPKFTKLLTAFHAESGIPILLNTSLNKKGTPMVETPEDAIMLFNETALDILVLENLVVTKIVQGDTKTLAYDEDMLTYLIDFVKEIGITVIEETLDDTCFLPGLKIQENSIRIDKTRLKYPGDILHEAGHLAVTDKSLRPLIGTPEMDLNWPSASDEIISILWSYAAICHLDIKPEVVFHPDGYKNDSAWLISQFENENYIGLPLLEWMGFFKNDPNDQGSNTHTFPKMAKWLRN